MTPKVSLSLSLSLSVSLFLVRWWHLGCIAHFSTSAVKNEGRFVLPSLSLPDRESHGPRQRFSTYDGLWPKSGSSQCLLWVGRERGISNISSPVRLRDALEKTGCGSKRLRTPALRTLMPEKKEEEEKTATSPSPLRNYQAFNGNGHKKKHEITRKKGIVIPHKKGWNVKLVSNQPGKLCSNSSRFFWVPKLIACWLIQHSSQIHKWLQQVQPKSLQVWREKIWKWSGQKKKTNHACLLACLLASLKASKLNEYLPSQSGPGEGEEEEWERRRGKKTGQVTQTHHPNAVQKKGGRRRRKRRRA